MQTLRMLSTCTTFEKIHKRFDSCKKFYCVCDMIESLLNLSKTNPQKTSDIFMDVLSFFEEKMNEML